MKRTRQHIQNEQGFTLLEIIITIIIGSILSTLIIPYLGKALTDSSKPIQRLSSAMGLKQVVENITEAYEQSPADLAGLKTSIGAEGSSQNNSYGAYQVVENLFIKFVSYNDTAISGGDPQNLLKVTIKDSATGEIVTTLFVQG
ncbi:MAG: prepilin-type N-terminal cleavage/methylation domain-containing protein [Dehalococcoidia bacterium]|nr:prepilin-type N-terminal cleavage/methylation domain-containing protein [Desulfobacterales bacterium]MDZ4246959.1 prepilin-type N-terminal cleavage/methylation domain-containing protein [Dehalococcoidia bacterium]